MKLIVKLTDNEMNALKDLTGMFGEASKELTGTEEDFSINEKNVEVINDNYHITYESDCHELAVSVSDIISVKVIDIFGDVIKGFTTVIKLITPKLQEVGKLFGGKTRTIIDGVEQGCEEESE